jgi:iron-sulfur cluster assembly protein
MEHVGIAAAAPVGRTESGEGDFKVTDAAVAQIVKLTRARKTDGKPTEALRIGLRGGGCDGFSYVFEWADKPAIKHDHVLEFIDPAAKAAGGDGTGGTVRMFIDKKSMLYLKGTTLNFVTGLMGHGFKFENPNVKGSCGCGESVQF